ncbi:MAG: GGDEF domain-containing protein [Planctomycetota bacterium]
MSNPATLSFSRTGTGLFTPEEVRALMQVEFERAQRYTYPIALLLIQVDHLAQIQTVHGFEAKQAVFEAVIELIKSETRDGDLLGTVVDDRLCALIPHTHPDAAKSVSDRILRGARTLQFYVAERTVRITLSIGLAHNQDPGATSIATLERVAEEGLSVADASGGDRMVETELYQLYERERTPVSREDIEELLARAEGMGYRQRLEGLVADGADLEEAADAVADEIIARAVATERARWQQDLESANEEIQRLAAAPPGEDPEAFKREIDQLHRRIAKLTASLETTEQEITRLRSLKTVDDGVASVYREVQGLEDGDARSEIKKELMGEIFRANMDLQGKRSA